MARGTAEIFIEPDGQYTTIITNTNGGGKVLVGTPGQNQTLTVAFNKGRDELATLLGGGVIAKRIVIAMDYDPAP